MSACKTGKLRYKDKLGARIALSQTAAKTDGRRNESRVYRCPSCAGWHLTSRERAS